MNSVSLECILKVISCVATVLPLFRGDIHCVHALHILCAQVRARASDR